MAYHSSSSAYSSSSSSGSRPSYSLQELFDYRKEGKLNLKDLTKCLNAISKNPDEAKIQSKQFQWLCKKIASESHNLKCKIISQLYYSITKIAVYGNIPSILLNALQNKTMKIMKDFDVFGVVQVIYAHAKLSIRVKEPLRMKMIQFISENSSKFNGQDVANTLYSIRKKCLDPIDKPVKKCVMKLLEKCEDLKANLKAMEIANIVHSASSIIHKIQFQKFRQLLQEICINVSTRLDIQHVSMILEGFVMGEIIFDENFVKSIFETIERHLSSSTMTNMQNLSSILYSILQMKICTSLSGIEDEKIRLVQVLTSEIKNSFKKANAQDIISLINVINLKPFQDFTNNSNKLLKKIKKYFIKHLDQKEYSSPSIFARTFHGLVKAMVGKNNDDSMGIVGNNTDNNNSNANSKRKTFTNDEMDAIIKHITNEIHLKSNGQDICQILHGLANLPANSNYNRNHMQQLLLDRLTNENILNMIKGTGISTVLFSLAKLKCRYLNENFVTSISKVLCLKINTFSNQDVGNSLWALAKLESIISRNNKIDVMDAVHALEVRFQKLKRLNINDVCNYIWAKATRTTSNDDIISLYGVDGKALFICDFQFLEQKLVENISNISPGQVAYLIWSFGKLSKLLLPYVINMKVLILLCHEYLKKNIAKMHAQNVGILAHGLAMIPLDKMRERVDGDTLKMEIHEAMYQHIGRTMDKMNWQSIAHLEFYNSVYKDHISTILRNNYRDTIDNDNDTINKRIEKMQEIATEALNNMSEDIKLNNKKLETVILEENPPKEILKDVKDERAKKTILLINLPSYIGEKYKKKGYNVVEWNRFSNNERAGEPWLSDRMETLQGGKVHGCIIGLGIFKENFTMISHCLTKLLQNGSYIYIYNKNCNASSIMIHNYLIKQLEALNMFTQLKNITPNIMKCKFNGFSLFSDNLKCKLKDWRTKTSITFDSSLLPSADRDARTTTWYTYPGLFAGGTIDIMTSYLLNTIQEKLKKKDTFKKVLDFCSGSGAIAYAYKNLIAKNNVDDIQISLLDADSVALEAAKKNVDDAKNYYLSDGWKNIDEDEKFDLIISNPPVHIGNQNCFNIMYDLIKGSANHLQNNGELWVVCQSYIPLTSLISPITSFGFATSTSYNDGRFSVHRFAIGISKGSSSGSSSGGGKKRKIIEIIHESNEKKEAEAEKETSSFKKKSSKKKKKKKRKKKER